MVRRVLLAAFILNVAGALCATAGLAISKDFDQSYKLERGGSFELQNVNGPVQVEGWDRDCGRSARGENGERWQCVGSGTGHH